MAIVCVTNLSPESLAAAHVAAAVAGRLQEPLLLLGVAEGDAFLGRRLRRADPHPAAAWRPRPRGSNAGAGGALPACRRAPPRTTVLSDEECRRARWIV
ncbi:universal stress protein, partial [Myxococcus sp. 1LA]